MIFCPPVIELIRVTKSFGAKVAVNGLSLKIGKGEVFGFLGPNGAGKTTTMKMILGLLRPDEGAITLFGEPAGSVAARRRIGFLPEFANYYQHLSGREFLTFVGQIFGLSREEIKNRSNRLLKLVNIAPEAQDRQISTYSKGMQQRIGMAQALINDPDILFLDEPMSGLDPIGRREMKDIILSLKSEGKTVFFNSHILSDAQEICDTVGIIHLGKLLKCDSVSGIVPAGKNLEEVFVETILGSKTPQETASKPATRASTSKPAPSSTAAPVKPVRKPAGRPRKQNTEKS